MSLCAVHAASCLYTGLCIATIAASVGEKLVCVFI